MDKRIANNDVDTPENLAFQELNEELDGIDNDSKLISTYTKILGTFLEKVKAWAYPWLSEEDDDFQRLLELYSWRFEELKNLSERGHEIEHVISQSIAKLNESVDTVIEGWDISEQLDKAYENNKETNETISKTQELEIMRDSFQWNIRLILKDIDIKSEKFQNYSEKHQEIVLWAMQVSSGDYVHENFDWEWNIIEASQESLIQEIEHLESVYQELTIALNNETLDWNETLLEKATGKIEKKFLDIKENGTEKQKEIIWEKSFVDMQQWDFMKLWLDGEVDLKSWFLTEKKSWAWDSDVWSVYTINFWGNPEVWKLLSSIISLDISKIVIDGKVATRKWETDFTLEWGLPVSIYDGSEIIFQKFEKEFTPEQMESRVESYRENMASNVNREEFERRVNNQIEQREMNWDENDDGWLVTMLKKIVNAMAGMMWEDPIFKEVLEKERELYWYSEHDMNLIEKQGMRRFSPNGNELLRDWEFMDKLRDVSKNLWIQTDDLLIVMQAESKIDPTAVNPRSWASWLIQFMPATAKWLGTSVEAIRNMSAVEQLKYVEAYFAPYANRMKWVEDIYRVVFYPASIWKPGNWVMWSQNGTAEIVAKQNGPWITKHSRRADGLIDNDTFDRYVQAKISQFSTVVSAWSGDTPKSIREDWELRISNNIVSNPVERSSKGTTLCSKTARLNLIDLWVNSPNRWGSAKSSFQQYNRDEISWFPPSDTTAVVADLYLDASPWNRQYWHRAACFKQDWEWFVLDPYYKIPWYENSRTSPIPADAYLNHMQNRLGRNIWWAAYFK